MAAPVVQQHDLRAVLAIVPFRRLWITLSLSSLGDWLGLLATTALASALVRKSQGSFAAQNFAIGGVLILRLLPALLLAPLSGAFADRFDRRHTMVISDLVRCGLFVSIPVVHTLTWLFVASFLIEVASLFWTPAKEAAVPNLVPPERLEAANQLSLLTTYGSGPVAAALFAGLAVVSHTLGAGFDFFTARPTDLALYFNGLTFLVAAGVVLVLPEISGRRSGVPADAPQPGIWASVREGWVFARSSPLIRGVLIGMLGAFAAGGFVVGLGRQYVTILGGGDAGWGVLFGTVFTGLALGMFLGPRLLAELSRRRLFGLAVIGAGVSLVATAAMPNLQSALVTVLLLGMFAGVGWVTGYTLLGVEVDDAIRGRTFALVQSLARITLLAVLALAPFVSGLIGQHTARLVRAPIRLDGVTLTLLAAGVLAAAVGVMAYRQMDDRAGIPLITDLVDAVRGRHAYAERLSHGVFVALEGGEGTGKSTQAQLLAQWLTTHGVEVVTTREPGATHAGRQLRELLLDPATGSLDARTEALLYAADRAEHVATVIRPALRQGQWVITDRYVDSSMAYQGAGRELASDEVDRLSRWATEGLVPDLTVLLDLDPRQGLARAGRRGNHDRIEGEPLEFHLRVREGFRTLAQRHPRRYLVVDAAGDEEQVAALVRAGVAARLAGRLPTAGPGTFPAPAPITDPALTSDPTPTTGRDLTTGPDPATDPAPAPQSAPTRTPR